MLGTKLDVDLFIQRREAENLRLQEHPSGRIWSLGFAAIFNDVLAQLEAEFRADFPGLPPISFVATGGFGRQEMSPHSDIDFLIIPLSEESATFDRAMHHLYRRIEDTFRDLKLKADYSYQLPTDAGVLDQKTRTAVLDGRLVAGSHEPWERFQHNFWESFSPGEFVHTKLAERREQLAKIGRTPLLVEPDLKLGFGGLRSYHLAQWIGTALGERPIGHTEAMEIVLRMRNLLHAVNSGNHNVLARPKAARIADLLGRELFGMMSELLDAQRELAALEDDALSRVREDRYTLTRHVMAIRGDVRISGSPRISEAAYGVALGDQLGLRIEPIEASASPVCDWRELREALQFGPQVVRVWERCHLLQTILPELQACRTLLPRDSTHRYSVFEHTMQALELLEHMRQTDGFWQSLWDDVTTPTTLTIAVLLHDVGKIDPERSHSEVGAEIATRVGERWAMDAASVADVQWLVRHHLAMAHTVRSRDIQHPETVAEFAELVQTPARLAMLTLLTVADIQAVNSELWTNLQETSLQDLYAATRAHLLEGFSPTPEPSSRRRELLRAMRADVPEAELERYVEALPAHYVLTTPSTTIREHYHMARMTTRDEPQIRLVADEERQVTDLTICAPDYRGLLSDALGVIYAYDLQLVGVRAATAQWPQHVAIDTLSICHAGRQVPSGIATQVENSLRKVLSGQLPLDILMQSKGKDPNLVQKVLKVTLKPGEPAILDVRAPQGRGMAYRISRAIAGAGWEILAARVGQWADHAVAAFYVENPSEGPIREADVARAFGAASIISLDV
ncbi:MAG: HD domain-containing protein [Chthonomonas sp.]|nr:HD domain-containing protein [Chthonomonas sp.]